MRDRFDGAREGAVETARLYAVEPVLRMVEVLGTPTLADDPNPDTVFDIEPVVRAGGSGRLIARPPADLSRKPIPYSSTNRSK